MLPPAALPSPAVLTPSSVPPPALPATSPSQWLVCKLACSVIVRCHLSSSGTSSLQPARAALCRAFSPSRSCSSLLDVNFSLEFSYFFFCERESGHVTTFALQRVAVARKLITRRQKATSEKRGRNRNHAETGPAERDRRHDAATNLQSAHESAHLSATFQPHSSSAPPSATHLAPLLRRSLTVHSCAPRPAKELAAKDLRDLHKICEARNFEHFRIFSSVTCVAGILFSSVTCVAYGNPSARAPFFPHASRACRKHVSRASGRGGRQGRSSSRGLKVVRNF